MKNWYRLRASRTSAELLIYDDIGFWGKTAKTLIAEIEALGPDIARIDLRINSPGGEVFEALAIYNALQRVPSQVITHIDGLCASAATLVALGADEVRMADNAMFMIHEPWTVVSGDSDKLQKKAGVLDALAENIVNIYARKTGAEADTIRQWMRDETWINADEALEAGFIDQIETPLKIAAMIRPHDVVSRFKNCPAEMRKMQSKTPETPTPETPTPETPTPETPTPETPTPETPTPETPTPETPAPLDAVTLSKMCLDAHEPGLTPILLATPHTEAQVRARLAQAREVRQICALVRLPEMADGLIAAGADVATAKAATWDTLVARQEANPIDSTPPHRESAQQPTPELTAVTALFGHSTEDLKAFGGLK